jgi:hypothetical protein
VTPLMACGLLASGLAVATSANAQLPPYWQRAAEMSAILDDRQVAATLRDRAVDRIEWRGPGRYRVTAGRCQLSVRTLAQSQGRLGAAKYRIVSGASFCR